MTEHDWLSCLDPQLMLAWLHQQGKLSDRKASHFAVGCSRRVVLMIRGEQSRKAIEVANRLSANRATERQRDPDVRGKGDNRQVAHATTAYASGSDCFVAAQAIAAEASRVFAGLAGVKERDRAKADEEAAQASVLRDLLAPFHTASFDPAWRTPAVLDLAQAAYSDRDLPSGHLRPDCLVELTVALAEAGCKDAELLAHLRSEGPHYRGCWSLDAVLGKE